ncbi:MAG: hypothetical protein FWD09_05525 [Lentimicrobiaceae bacterium]|nr:hypothetical protein [Lentimicrobiaceae bacterium]
MKNKKRTSGKLIFLLFGALFLFNMCTSKFNSGDLIFVSSETSDFEKSIVEVTKSENKALNFSHVGIINVTDSGIFVVEAAPEKGVVYTSLQVFKDENQNGVLYVGSLKSAYKKYANNALSRACDHLGKGYDYAFDFENDLYYCSELVYDAYTYASGDFQFFETSDMSFKKEGADEVLPYWVSYFEKLNISVPEGKLGVNPTGIGRSDKLRRLTRSNKIVYQKKPPKEANMNNPVQAVGAARGRENRHQYQNSVGVQHLSALCCAPTEHRISVLHRFTPSCGYRLARGYSHFTPAAWCQNLNKKNIL